MNLAESVRADSRQWRMVAIVATIIATTGIVSTYPVFSNMYDEPAHIAAGMEWLSSGTFRLEPQHPPLSRVASAFLPWLSGERSVGYPYMFTEGRAILGRGDHYWKVLTLARLGQLPFFFALVWVVWFWTRRVADERTAAIAVGFVATNPNILAHAGVAGTDIGPAALMPAALLAWCLWLLSPTVTRSVVFGVVLALCTLTKFSAAAYWVPAACGVALLYAAFQPDKMPWLSGARRLARPFGIAAAAGALTTWEMYRFSFGPVGTLKLPAPEFWTGLYDFFRHGTGGHPSYLLGESRMMGWWYYDIVALAVKTPIPLMLFGALGAYVAFDAVRRLRRADSARALLIGAPVMGVASVVALASATPVDIGVRLDLPAYTMLAIVAALAVSWCIERARTWAPRVALAALGAWAVTIPVAAQPDHIAYFNAFAGKEPDKILVDSNLDWGQDLERLRVVRQELGIDSLFVHYFGTAEFAALGLTHARRLRPTERATGWIAASETFYVGLWADTALNWLQAYKPVGHVGKSIRLYHIIPPSP